MGVEYDIDKGFTNETSPGLFYAPDKIASLREQIVELDWEGKPTQHLRTQLAAIEQAYAESRSEYLPLF